MTISQRVTLLAVLGVAIVAGLSYANRPVGIVKPDTVVIQRSAKAETVSLRTLKVVTDTRVILDSIFAVDTLWQHDTVVRVVVESLMVQCQRCARELATFRQFTDSVIRSRDVTIADLRNQLASSKKQRPWYALGGAVVGALAAR